jgi:hypothetical protein
MTESRDERHARTDESYYVNDTTKSNVGPGQTRGFNKEELIFVETVLLPIEVKARQTWLCYLAVRHFKEISCAKPTLFARHLSS